MWQKPRAFNEMRGAVKMAVNDHGQHGSHSLVSTILGVLVPVHEEGWKFVGAALAAAFVGWLIWTPLAWLFLVLAGAIAYFFRDPKRFTPAREGLEAPATTWKPGRLATALWRGSSSFAFLRLCLSLLLAAAARRHAAVQEELAWLMKEWEEAAELL